MFPKIKSCLHVIWRFCWGQSPRWRCSSRIDFKLFFWFIISCGWICAIIFLISFNYSADQEISIDLSHNYFRSKEALKNERFLVNTTKCQIPEIDIWDAEILSLVKPPTDFKCTEKAINLTFVEKDTVVINEDVLKSHGYTLDDITCCYRTIERVEQTYESYDMNADNLFRFSEVCASMGKRTKPKSGFIEVTCTAKNFHLGPFSKYTNFHMLAMFTSTDDKVLRKLTWWQNCLSTSEDETCAKFRDKGRPPNIMMIGWDSTSRSNFRRFMPKTLDILENDIQAVEMVGFNKVGENTLPNFIPLISPLSLDDLIKECISNYSLPLDPCPLIWKQFNAHNYLTVLVEDHPEIGMFNNAKTGFIKQPTDIYTRFFMLAAYGQGKSYFSDFSGCIGYQRPEDLLLNYVVDLAELAESSGIPYMMTAWLTDLTHSYMSDLQLADEQMARTLTKMIEKGLLENTILILISDHGYRFLEIRMTGPGWYEDKLPMLWIKVPPSLAKVQATWLEALQYNSRMLTTPFDIHEIFQQILATFWSDSSEGAKAIVASENTHRGKSLFKKISERNCEQAGIPNEFCSCIPPTACNLNSTFIKLAANMVVEDVNNLIPPECTRLKVATITACGTINKTNSITRSQDAHSVETKNSFDMTDGNDSGDNPSSDELIVIVALYTAPGNFLFEAMVHFNASTKQFFKVSKVSRMNMKKHNSACLVVNDSWLELLCYCEPLSILKTVVGRFLP